MISPSLDPYLSLDRKDKGVICKTLSRSLIKPYCLSSRQQFLILDKTEGHSSCPQETHGLGEMVKDHLIIILTVWQVLR